MGVLTRTFMVLREIAAPSTPASGESAWYAGTDHRPYMKNDGGEALRLDNTSVRDYTKNGDLTVHTGTIPLVLPFPVVFERVDIAVVTAPTGAAVIVDVNKNGTTLFSTQSNRPQIAASATQGNTTTFNTTTGAAGDKLTIDVDQIGSTLPGTTLVVAIAMRRTG